jgi:uncharacterized membrane protein HdeD (DUF308 family)
MSAAASPAREMKKAGGLAMILGILLVVLGFVAVGSPLVTGVAVALSVGILVIVGGIARVVVAFSRSSWHSK